MLRFQWIFKDIVTGRVVQWSLRSALVPKVLGLNQTFEQSMLNASSWMLNEAKSFYSRILQSITSS